jgi:hydrogenase nickel incorporation protein HypA/HybF
MHELSIVASLFEILEAKARENQATKIVRVRLRVGKLAGVVPEFLQTAFDSYKQDTIAAESQLEIEEVALKMRCRECTAEIEKEDFVLVCPSCGSTDLEILEGMELLLDKIDLEI